MKKKEIDSAMKRENKEERERGRKWRPRRRRKQQKKLPMLVNHVAVVCGEME